MESLYAWTEDGFYLPMVKSDVQPGTRLRICQRSLEKILRGMTIRASRRSYIVVNLIFNRYFGLDMINNIDISVNFAQSSTDILGIIDLRLPFMLPTPCLATTPLL